MGDAVHFIFFLISFISCAVGAICGIGGGVIIKPVLDAFGILGIDEISFLSGCTVLSMTCYSVCFAVIKNDSVIELKTSTPLAIGGAAGGVLGKSIFHMAVLMFRDGDAVGAVQAICLFILTLGTLIFTLNRSHIRTGQTKSLAACLCIGLFLGLISSFLSIGGGPINLVVLYFFFSMDAKTAAQNSLYIILFSQIASLLQTIIGDSLPEFEPVILIGMAACGVLGGAAGRKLNRRLDNTMVTKLFVFLMILILFINAYNAYQFIN